MLCVIAIYIAAMIDVHVLSAPGLAATPTPAAEVASRLVETARVLSLLIVISTFGFMNLALMAPPRVYYAMAADGVFFQRVDAQPAVPGAYGGDPAAGGAGLGLRHHPQL